MKRSHWVSDLAQLLLKNQFELRDSAARFMAGKPYEIALSLGGQGRRSTMSVEARDGYLVVNFKEDARSYEVRVPLKPTAQSLFHVSMTDNGTPYALDVKPEDFLGAKLPESFTSLHEKVAQYLKALLPESFFTKSTAEQTAEQTAASAPSSATAPEAPTPEPAAPVPGKEAPSEYATYLVERANQPDLKFQGKLIAAAQSFPLNGRYFDYRVYVTPSGKYVGLQVGVSLRLSEKDRAQVQVAEKLEALVEFFGYNALAKALYQQLDLAHEEVID